MCARHAAWVFLLPACFHPSYDHPTCGPGGECPDGLTCSALRICEDNSTDAAILPTDATVDGNLQPFCDPSDPHLVACYEFEGDTRDSSNNHLDASMFNVSFPPGKTGQAMLFGATSADDVPNSAAFDVTALTIEA